MLNQKNNLLSFIKNNPEFNKLTTDQKKDLIIKVFKNLKNRDKNLITTSQGITTFDCFSNYEAGFASAENTFDAQVLAAHIGLVLCIGLSEGIATPACLELYSYGLLAIEIQFWASMLQLEVGLNECLQ